MGYPGRQNIYKATIRRMVQQALAQQEQEFRTLHEGDTDAELLMYLRSCASRLHHTPWPGEITGGSLILDRMGSWERAVLLAKLPAPRGLNQQQDFARYQEETVRQQEIYRQKKAEKKILAQQRTARQNARKKQEHET